MRGLSPRMKVVAPAAAPHISCMWGGYLILCSAPFSPPPTADGEAMSSAATVETFSIMSTHGRALKCNGRGFAGTCAETRPEEFRCRLGGKKKVSRFLISIPNIEVSPLIKGIVIKSVNAFREQVCSFMTPPNHSEEENMANIGN